jgi:hypothetical protein
MRTSIATSITTSLLVTLVATASASAQSFAKPPGAPPPASITAERGGDQREIRDLLRDALTARRQASLAAFARYVDTGSFPANVHKAGELNVWRDAQGRYCAAAAIIRASGKTALVDKVAADNNFIVLGDVKQGPLLDWILTSGLTQEEIALIQRPFRGTSKQPLEESGEIAGAGVVDPTMRDAEQVRLMGLYRGIQTTLTRNFNASIETAIARLMKNPTLMQRWLAETGA